MSVRSRAAGRRPSRLVAAAVIALLAAALTGCAGTTAPAPVTGGAPAPVTSALGAIGIQAPPGDPDAPDLAVTGATLLPGPAGTEELRMTVTNRGDAPEHLYGVSTPDTTTAELLDAPTTAGAAGQPAGAAGVDLEPGTTTAFGPAGPRVLLDQPHGLARGRLVTVTLLFALAGLVHLTTPVDS
jgi:copper(I)-binding protein